MRLRSSSPLARFPLGRRGLALAALLALLGSTGAAAAQELAPAAAPVLTSAPPEDTLRYPPTPVRWKLVVGGLAFTAATYGAAAGLGAAFDDAEVPGATALYVPIAGPWIALGQLDCGPTEATSCGELNVLRGILYVLDGVAQAGGLGIAAEGIFATTEAAPARAAEVVVAPTAIVTPGGAGLGLRGSF